MKKIKIYSEENVKKYIEDHSDLSLMIKSEVYTKTPVIFEMDVKDDFDLWGGPFLLNGKTYSASTSYKNEYLVREIAKLDMDTPIEKMKSENYDDYVCPVCGTEAQDCWEMSDDNGEVECDECGSKLDWERETTVVMKTKVIKRCEVRSIQEGKPGNNKEELKFVRVEMLQEVTDEKQDSIWYGGDVAKVVFEKKDGTEVDFVICANGDACGRIYKNNEELFSFKDKSNAGIFPVVLEKYLDINSDEELSKIASFDEDVKENYELVAFSNNNWWELFIEKEDEDVEEIIGESCIYDCIEYVKNNADSLYKN